MRAPATASAGPHHRRRARTKAGVRRARRVRLPGGHRERPAADSEADPRIRGLRRRRSLLVQEAADDRGRRALLHLPAPSGPRHPGRDGQRRSQTGGQSCASQASPHGFQAGRSDSNQATSRRESHRSTTSRRHEHRRVPRPPRPLGLLELGPSRPATGSRGRLRGRQAARQHRERSTGHPGHRTRARPRLPPRHSQGTMGPMADEYDQLRAEHQLPSAHDDCVSQSDGMVEAMNRHLGVRKRLLTYFPGGSTRPG